MTETIHTDLKQARILVVDDEPANVLLLQRILQQAGYECVVTTTDSREVEALCQAATPDLVLLDLMMPYIDGFDIIEMLGPLMSQSYLPILVLTADVSSKVKHRALSCGARDFVTKPFDHLEVLSRVRNLLETRLLYQQLRDQNLYLEERVQQRTQQLEESNAHLQRSKLEIEESQLEVLQRLAQAAEFRDDDTGQHTQRVGTFAARLAQALNLSDDQIHLIRRTAPLHDVGKIGISDLILLKPGKLTAEEFATMKTHAEIGAKLLSQGHSPLVQMAHSIALTHHERWDGGGYPRGLSGEAIPIEGRILAIADVFDALTHARPYKEAWPVEAAIAEITAQSGRQFDPTVVRAFLSLFTCDSSCNSNVEFNT